MLILNTRIDYRHYRIILRDTATPAYPATSASSRGMMKEMSRFRLRLGGDTLIWSINAQPSEPPMRRDAARAER